MLTDKGCSCTSSWGKSVVLALSYINYRLVSWNAQLFINAQSQQRFPTSRCSAANSLPPKPFYDNPVSKRKLPVCNNWEESSKCLVTPWPCNPWPFTLLYLHITVIRYCSGALECTHFPRQEAWKPVYVLFPMKKCCTFQCWSSPEDWSLLFQTCLILIQSGHHHEVHHTHPCSQGEMKVLQVTFSFYLNRLEIEVHAFRETVTFVTENSFDLSLIFANSAAD